jgi:hypothetical protein
MMIICSETASKDLLLNQITFEDRIASPNRKTTKREDVLGSLFDKKADAHIGRHSQYHLVLRPAEKAFIVAIVG